MSTASGTELILEEWENYTFHFYTDRLLVDRSTLAHLIYGVLLVSGFTRGV